MLPKFYCFFFCLFHVCVFLLSDRVFVSRRNTSVDESYEWDSADACVDSEVLEATRFDPSQIGCRRGRGGLGFEQAGGLQDPQRTGDHFFYIFQVFEFYFFLNVACTSDSVTLDVVLHV